MKLMNLVKSASWVFLGMLAATNASFAQEISQNALPAERSSRSPSDSYDALLRNAEALIKSGKPHEAYILLEPLEFEHAGKARFDYLLGIAALDSGKPDRATFAFERVLAVSPDFTAARLDMARAYYQLGDLPRARTEFTAVLKQNPSLPVRANVQKYVDAIDAQREGKRTRITAYLEASAGRDSNVNYSTSEQRIFVDRFAAISTIDPSNVQVADSYYGAGAGAHIEYGLNDHWMLYAQGDVRTRANGTHTQFDTRGLDVHAGVKFETRADSVRMGVLGGKYRLDGERHSDTAGLAGEWRHVFSPANQLNAFAQQVKFRFADPLMKLNDFDQQAIGFGWLHALRKGKAAVSGSVHLGNEKDVSPILTVASPDGGRNDGAKFFRGLRVGGQTAVGDSTVLFASAGMQNGDYDKINYYFQRKRNDRLRDMTLGANWHWSKLWTLRPQIAYSRNDSNIAIYDYHRTDVSLMVRRDFR